MLQGKNTASGAGTGAVIKVTIPQHCFFVIESHGRVFVERQEHLPT
jgi:hypothetical protein